MGLKKILRDYVAKPTMALALVGTLVGCGGRPSKDQKRKFDESNTPIVGTVIEEKYFSGNLAGVPEKHIRGLVSQAYSSETVKLEGPKYIIKIKTDNGKVLTVSVIDDNNGMKEALETIIEKGSKISFPKGNLWMYNDLGDIIVLEDKTQTYFWDDVKFGAKKATNIKVLN